MVRLPVDLIDETERLREPDDDHVKLIAASIADCGQIAPIHVRPTKDGRYEMIDGGHRLAAIRAAGQPTILAIVFDGDESGAGWLRTDGNLIRHDLNALDRGVFLKERRALFNQRRQRSNSAQPIDEADSAILALGDGFVREAGKKLRISRRDVFRGLARAGLPEDVRKRIAPTDLALNGAALDALVRLGDADKQRRAVALVLDEGRKLADALREVRGLAPASGAAATDRFAKFVRLWKQMDAHERQRVREHMSEKPSRAHGKRPD